MAGKFRCDAAAMKGVPKHIQNITCALAQILAFGP
jgi:hypothetical protein